MQQGGKYLTTWGKIPQYSLWRAHQIKDGQVQQKHTEWQNRPILGLGQMKLCWLYIALHDIWSLMEFGNQNFTTLVATLRIPNWFPIQYYDVTWIMRFKPFTFYQPGLQLARPRGRSWDMEQNMTSQPVVCHALLLCIKQYCLINNQYISRFTIYHYQRSHSPWSLELGKERHELQKAKLKWYHT